MTNLNKCSSVQRRPRFRRIESNKVLHVTNTHKKFLMLFMWTFSLQDTCMRQWQDTQPGPGGLITATNQLWDSKCPFHLGFRWLTCKMNELSYITSSSFLHIIIWFSDLHRKVVFSEGPTLFSERGRGSWKPVSDFASPNKKGCILFNHMQSVWSV